MLERMHDMPEGVDGLRAKGKLTRRDVDEVVQPLLRDARRDSRRIRILYEFAPEFDRFTAGAALEDARMGLNYSSLVERCAVVSDAAAIRARAQRLGALFPCPVRAFATREAGLGWLVARITPHLLHRLIEERGVVVIEPTGALRPEDFQAIARVVDPWIESHGALRGLVLRMREFPGWESLGAFVRHIQFVGAHQRWVRRVAIATDSLVGQLMPSIVDRFVKTDLRAFPYGQLDPAIVWAGQGE